MMKKLLLLFLLLVPGCAFAQQITITGTVKDPNNIPFTNGRGRVLLTPTNVFFTTGLTNPVPGSQSPVIIDGLDAFGKFSVTLTSTAALDQQAANPKWMFTFCSAPIQQFGPICFTMAPLALTSSQDITGQISATPPPILPSTGGTGTPGGVPIQTQVNNGGSFGGTPCQSFADINLGPANVDCDWHSKGPNPYVDITRFGARACDPGTTPCAVGLTASTTSGLTSVTISSPSTFVNGDGLVIYGAGATNTMSTPSAPTVTPSVARVMTGTNLVSNGPTGSSTYNYQIFAEDKNGGLTAVSAVASTTTGAASLGSQSVGLSSCTRSNDIVTCTTSSAHGLGAGAQMVIIQGGTDLSFDGFYTTSTVADSTHFSFSSGQDTRNGATTSTTGGTVFWFNCNHITWTAVAGAYRYWIAGRTGGSLTTIGWAWPTNPLDTTFNSLAWDDFGSPMMDNFALPAWIPSTPPASATNDNLATTIVSGGGTTNLTLGAAAGKTVSGVTIRLDAGVGLKAAIVASFAGPEGTGYPVYVPQIVTNQFGTGHASFVVNSLVDLTSLSPVALVFAGKTVLENTIIFPGGSRVSGLPTMGSFSSSFGMEGLPLLNVDTAYPGMHFAGTGGANLIEHLFVNTNTNQGVDLLEDGGSPSTGLTLRKVYLGGGSSVNYMGIPLLARGVALDGNIQLDDVTISTGPGVPPGVPIGTTATPQIYCTACGQSSATKFSMASRGILLGMSPAGTAAFKLDWGYSAGGLIPFLSVTGGGGAGNIYFDGPVALDTFTPPLLAVFPGAAVIVRDQSFGTPSGVSPTHPVYSGLKPSLESGRSQFEFPNLGLNRDNSGFSTGFAVNGTLGVNTASPQGINYNAASLAVGPSYEVFVDAPPMAAPSATVTAGGSVPVGVHAYQIAPVWQNGGVGNPSFVRSVTTTTGNQTVNLTWTPVSGNCKGYSILRDSNMLTNNVPVIGLTSCSASSFSDTLGLTSGGSGVQQPGGGPTMMMSGLQGIVSPTITAGIFTDVAANAALTGLLRLVSSDSITWRNNANSGDLGLFKTGAASGTLLSDILSATNFGSLAANNFLSGNANPAASGLFRLVNTETISWRNNANNADLALAKNVSDILTWPSAISPGGGLLDSGISSAVLTGTGACATFSGQVGGKLAGSAACASATAASTLTIGSLPTAAHGYVCSVQDETTRANLFQQTAHTTTSCTLTITSVTQNDVFVFTAVGF